MQILFFLLTTAINLSGDRNQSIVHPQTFDNSPVKGVEGSFPMHAILLKAPYISFPVA